jgi:hypothetical protein
VSVKHARAQGEIGVGNVDFGGHGARIHLESPRESYDFTVPDAFKSGNIDENVSSGLDQGNIRFRNGHSKTEQIALRDTNHGLDFVLEAVPAWMSDPTSA